MLDYKKFQESDFWSFFKIHEKEKLINVNDSTTITLEPGGFQEHIHLDVKVQNNTNLILDGLLILDRDWVGDTSSLNAFAKDICKSFIVTLCSLQDNKLIDDIVDGIMNITGENDHVIYQTHPKPFEERMHETKKAILVYMGIERYFMLNLPNLKIFFENREKAGKKKLHISIELH